MPPYLPARSPSPAALLPKRKRKGVCHCASSLTSLTSCLSCRRAVVVSLALRLLQRPLLNPCSCPAVQLLCCCFVRATECAELCDCRFQISASSVAAAFPQLAQHNISFTSPHKTQPR